MTKHQKHLMDVRASKSLANTDWREDNECYAYIDGYEQCIIDQRKIDVEKACNLFRGCLVAMNKTFKEYLFSVNEQTEFFRKAMED